jgi:hypothetical protein
MIDNTEAPAEMPAQIAPPSFVGGKVRSKIIPLEWPLEYGGKTYDSVTVRRMSATEVSQFFNDESDTKRLPMFDCPHEVIDALDADDSEVVSQAVIDFLPRRMQPASE